MSIARSAMEVDHFDWSVAPLSLWLRLLFVDISTEKTGLMTNIRCVCAFVSFLLAFVCYIFSFVQFLSEGSNFYGLNNLKNLTIIDWVHMAILRMNWAIQWLVAHSCLLVISKHAWPNLLQSFKCINDQVGMNQHDLRRMRRITGASLLYIIFIVSNLGLKSTQINI